MMLKIRELFIPFVCVVLAACDSNSDQPISRGGDDIANITDSERVDTQALTTVDGHRISWPADYSRTSGSGTVSFQSGSYENQVSEVQSNADGSIVCFTATELTPSIWTLDTVNAQIVSSYDATVVSVADINTDGFAGQEYVLNTRNASGEDITRLARHSYIPSHRFFIETDESAVFYFTCSTFSALYAQNEPEMRRILDSVTFTTTTQTLPKGASCNGPCGTLTTYRAIKP